MLTDAVGSVFGSARPRVRSSEALHPDPALLPSRRRSLGAKGEPEVQNGRLSLSGTILRWFMKSSAEVSPGDARDHLEYLAGGLPAPARPRRGSRPKSGR